MDLPDELELPLRSGEPYWYWLGGRPAMDLVNTLRERWWRRVETLVTLADLTRWLERVELLAPGSGASPSSQQLCGARELRESIDQAVVVLIAGDAVDPLEHALGTLALDAARMLGSDQRSRVRICASDTCSARFYDRSPTAARQWCSMRGCGNVAKARRHRARTRG